MATLDNFFVALCQRMGWEPTTWRLGVLKKMAEMEGNIDHLQQMWNPLSTTHPYGKASNWNSVGVGIYPDLATGVEATARTLTEPQYAGLVATMQTQSPQPGVEQGLMTWGWQDGNQLSPAGQQILGAMGGTATGTTQGTEGGVTMAGKTDTSAAEKRIEDMFAKADELLAADDPYGASELYTSAYNLAKLYGIGVSDTGTTTTTTTIPSAQETAIGQFDMETALNDAVLDWDKFGADVATQNFVNKLNAAQEGRLQATAAQEYAQQLAPPGMTTLPGVGSTSVVSQIGQQMGFAPRPDIPLPTAPAGSFGQAMQQANVPQAPDLQYTPGALPQISNLGAMSNAQTSTQVQVPHGLPTGTTSGNQVTGNSSLMQAIRNYMQRIGSTFGGAASGQLPLGG